MRLCPAGALSGSNVDVVMVLLGSVAVVLIAVVAGVVMAAGEKQVLVPVVFKV